MTYESILAEIAKVLGMSLNESYGPCAHDRMFERYEGPQIYSVNVVKLQHGITLVALLPAQHGCVVKETIPERFEVTADPPSNTTVEPLADVLKHVKDNWVGKVRRDLN